MVLLFLQTFKNNPSLGRAILTGVTCFPKGSIFSGLNNLKVITTTSARYADCFGFTEEETFAALDMYDMSEEKSKVKDYYDRFIMGDGIEIYNLWSVINFLSERKYKAYWANTSANRLIDSSIRHADSRIKKQMEQLLKDHSIIVEIDEEIVFSQLEDNPEALWSLLIASGYLNVCNVCENTYTLAITNHEAKGLFESIVKGWFKKESSSYNEFIVAMLNGRYKQMEKTLNLL